jgi:[ribosomal protein S18]-alanine N-acetyltransferase
MSVRPAVLGDVPALVAIHAASFEAGWDRGALTSFVEAGQASVIGNPVAGFVIMAQVLDEAEIITLAVAPQHRQSGVAKTLLITQFDVLRRAGVSRIFLEVASDNDAARHLYNALGFTQIGIRKAYYHRADSTRVDALTLSRSWA